jgi:hypothetical protein
MSKEGFWRIEFTGVAGSGIGVLALDTGIICGAGAAGGIFDGSYLFDPRSNVLDCSITWTASEPGITLVQGGPPVPQGFRFTVPVQLPNSMGQVVTLPVQTPLGQVNVRLTKIRDFPP